MPARASEVLLIGAVAMASSRLARQTLYGEDDRCLRRLSGSGLLAPHFYLGAFSPGRRGESITGLSR
jgi:hypothetical protein